jgi:hypothetical protein
VVTTLTAPEDDLGDETVRQANRTKDVGAVVEAATSVSQVSSIDGLRKGQNIQVIGACELLEGKNDHSN